MYPYLKSKYTKSLFLFLTICYIGIIFYLSSLSTLLLDLGISTRTERFLWNLAHIPSYGLLALLLSLFIRSKWWVLACSMSVAIFDELYQATVIGRMSSLMDIMMDCIGVIIVLWIIHGRPFFRITQENEI